jgi:hypothetical protein
MDSSKKKKRKKEMKADLKTQIDALVSSIDAYQARTDSHHFHNEGFRRKNRSQDGEAPETN